MTVNNIERDDFEPLSTWKKGHRLLKQLRETYWADVVLKYRSEWKTPWEIRDILG
jgi:hypothetical protein